MVYICLAQINRKWRETWHIKIYPKSVKRLIIASQTPQRDPKGVKNARKTPNNLRTRNKPEKVPEGLSWVEDCIYSKRIKCLLDASMG